MNRYHRHQLPCRLRMRFTQLKRDAYRLAMVAADLRAIGGMLSVEGSPLTGALLMQYDRVHGSTRRFWTDVEVILLAHHLRHEPSPLECQPSAAGSGPGRTVIGALAGRLVDRLVERAAMALVAALF